MATDPCSFSSLDSASLEQYSTLKKSGAPPADSMHAALSNARAMYSKPKLSDPGHYLFLGSGVEGILETESFDFHSGSSQVSKVAHQGGEWTDDAPDPVAAGGWELVPGRIVLLPNGGIAALGVLSWGWEGSARSDVSACILTLSDWMHQWNEVADIPIPTMEVSEIWETELSGDGLQSQPEGRANRKRTRYDVGKTSRNIIFRAMG